MSFFSGPDKELETYTAQVNGKAVTKRLPKGLSDDDVRRAFQQDYAAANLNALMAPIRDQSPKKHQLNALMPEIKSRTPGVSEWAGDQISRALVGAGMEERHAYRWGNKFEGLLSALTPAGNVDDFMSADSDFEKQMAILPLPGPLKDGLRKGIKAWHVSPHDFDKFSLNHIGTGEGAQAYGRGLYFSERPDGPTANHYRELFGPKSKTYEVEIDAQPDQLLDYDAPAWDQPENVRRLLQETGTYREKPELPITQTPGGRYSLKNIWGESAGAFKSLDAAEAKRRAMIDGMGVGTGNLLYGRLGGNVYFPHLDDGTASRRLVSEGIPGGKWRNASDEPNYVIFDDRRINILGKY